MNRMFTITSEDFEAATSDLKINLKEYEKEYIFLAASDEILEIAHKVFRDKALIYSNQIKPTMEELRSQDE